MGQTSTKGKAAVKPCLVSCFSTASRATRHTPNRFSKAYGRLLATTLALLISVMGFAHTVDSYSATCGAGPQYTVTAAVSSVNSTSNYRWQWKNASGSWICFVNGNNTINGNTYNVSGAVFNLTTTPGALVFTNPTSGLQGLEIRMVISDGAGVDPCTLPSGNTWTSSTNHFISVTGTSCGGGSTPCSCPGNIVQNPSFENGTTSWSWGGGNLYAGTGAVKCGVASGDLEITTTSGWTDQTIGTDLAVGTVLTASVWAGTHDNTRNNWVAIQFFNASWTHLSQSVYVQVDKILANAPSGPQLYTFTATVPAGTKYTKVAFGGDGSWTKTDQWCVTTTAPPVCTGRVTSLYFNKLDGGADLPISNGASFTVAQLGSLYNLEAGTTGTVGSVRFTVTGPTAGTNVENTAPYNHPGGTLAWAPTAGSYSVNIKTYNAADGGGTQCHDTTITFTVTAPCNPDDNTAGNGTAFCAPAPTCPSGSFLWSQSINSSNGTPSIVRLVGGSTNSYTIPVASYPAAFAGPVTINITDVVSYDGYVNRNTVTQTNERWRILFKKAGVVVHATAYTTDVPDLVNQGYWRGALGSGINLPNGTDEIVIEHINVAGGTTGPGSVVPVSICMSFTPITGSIGDRVWFDANGNGIQDATETGGITGVTVQLKNSAGTVIATTTTNGTGNYLFSNLAPGNYTVVFPASISGAIVTIPNVGSDDNVDSDANQSTGETGVITLGAGQNITNVDAGYCPITLVLGNFVWLDRNNNGTQDAGEPGIGSATVRLYKDDNGDNVPDGAAIASTTTDANGGYSFTALGPGNYIVGVVIPAGHAGSATTATSAAPNNDNNTDNNGVTTVAGELRSNFITITGGGEPTTDGDGNNGNLTLDFGLRGTGSIGDFVWNDLNGNGIQDTGEPGISGATVTLTYPGGATVTTTTDGNGGYLFSNLPPTAAGQSYTVTFTTPGGFGPAPANQGGDDTKDSDPVGGVVSGITLTAGQNNTTVDAGFQSTGLNLGNFVWLDRNNNGTQDAGEPGIVGATVNLYRDANGDNVPDGAAIATTTTGAGGIYGFGSLTPGNYIVGVVIPAGHAGSATTATSAAPNNDNNTDNNGVTTVAGELRSNFITLTTGGEPTTDGDGNNGNLTLDFGLRGTGSIGDFVWNDTNGNGIQDTGENGIGGATVTLTYPDGTTASTTTNGAGGYLFSNLPPTAAGQSYTVTFTTPAGFNPSPANQGSDDAKDSDPVGGVVSGITLTAGQNNLTVDAGFVACPGAPTAQGTTICTGASATLTATGVAGASFAWYSAATGGTLLASSATFTTPNLTATTTYFVQQTVAGCPTSARTPVTVTVVSAPTSGINGPTTICANEPALFTATGAGVGAVYNWTFGSGTPATATGASATSSWSAVGEYPITLTVTLNGCTVSYNRTIVITQAVFAAAGPDREICQGGNVTLNGSGPAGANYSWTVVSGDPTSIDNGASQANVLVSPLVTTVYRLIVTQNGCTRTDEVTVTTNVNNNPTANAGTGFTTCAGVGVVLGGSPTGTAPVTSPGAALGYSWSPSTGLNSSTIANPTLTLATPGVYTYQVIVFTLATGCSDTATVQVTVQACLNLGNFVWFDRNNNGTQDAGEPGIVGATVNLYRDANSDNLPDGAAIASTPTLAGGLYNFSNLLPGNYITGVVIPAGYAAAATTATSANPNNDDNTDNNGVTTVAGELRSNFITLSNGGEPTTDGDGNNGNLTLDFGLRGTGSIGDFVWRDVDGNGVQDAGETGIAGATVTLTYPDGATVTTTTDANGGYLFSNLPPTAPGQSYTVTFSTPSGFTPSPANQGSDDTKDSDAVGGTVSGITLTAGQNNTTIDAGFVPPLVGSIGDRVWNDIDRDGIQDANEVGVAGVTVSLFNNAGALIATTSTDALGNYLFSNLPVSPAGINYQVRFSLPAEYTFSPQNAPGSTATNNSDANVTTGRTGNITLTNVSKDRTDIDAGIYYTIPARIGDFIWNDTDKDGIQDIGEPGIAGVTVTLYDAAGNALRTTITDNNGYYQFTDVPVGNYTIGLTPPVGYILSPGNVGGDDTDSDFDAGSFRTAPFSVTPGTTDLSFDGGLNVTPPTKAAVGDRVWNDLNNNGLQDAGEPGVSGVTVQLYSYIAGVSTLVATTTTDAFGNYMFNDLVPTDYYVKFSNFPAGYVLVAPNVGGAPNDAIDSDVEDTFGPGTTNWFSLAPDETRVTVDAGVRNTVTALSSLGDFVWYDINKNGIQEAGEAGVPGITATLYNATTGAVIKTTTTDGTGRYLFTDLPNGSYSVGFSSLPSGYVFTGRDLTTDALDSDVDPSTGRTGTYTITTPGTNLTVDAGIFATPNVNNAKATIGDKVWNDVNGNGIQDAGEPGVAGVTVTLYAGDGTTVIGTTTTDGAGNYIFTNLDAGNYVVGFSNLPAGFVFTTQNAGTDPTKDSNPNTGTGKTAPITLAAGEINLTIDAGIRATVAKSALGDRVWFDNNANGIQDAGETGAGGVSVTLYNGAGAILATTVTDATGLYLFPDLDPGTYVVGFSNLPAGYTATTQNAAGSTAANNSDADAFTLLTGNIVLPASTTDLTWDLGIISTSRAALGNYVWLDANNNGIQDATERGAPGVTVTLYNSSNVAIASTVTDASGMYMFNNLNPGVYTVGFSNIPVNTSFTTKNAAGSNTANNSDVNVGTGRTDAVTLAAGQIRTDVDAGLVSNFAAVGDFVWYDVNVNGRQDAGEPGVPGVTVRLLDASTGNVVASAVTDGNGRYFINNIPVPATGSSFIIAFSDLPINTVGYTIKNAPGTTVANNSNANPANGRTDAFTLLPGQVDITIDAGIITDGGGPLPVTFTKLSGVYTNGLSKLNWATLSEQNFSHFEVEFSKDGINFDRLGNVAGNGNSNSRIEYGFNHLQPVVGANYYRLRIVDKDGKFTYSNTVLLNVTLKGITITAVYPSPFIDKVNVAITAATAEKVTIRLFDNAGKLVYGNETLVQAGINNLSISNLGKLAAGTYVIQVNAGDVVLTKQLMK
jgi:hypothetical protein